MGSNRLQMKLDPTEDKLLLPSSSEDEDDLKSSDEDHQIQDPFQSDGDSDFEGASEMAPFKSAFDEESDSDGPPEIISFKSTLEEMKKQQQERNQTIKSHQDEKRKRRRERHEEFLLQKEEKRQKVDEKKLPDDILENLKDDLPSENKVSFEDESGFEDDEDKKNLDDVVAVHGSTVFKCKVLSVEAKKPKFVPESVANFKNNLLYGGRIRREKNTRTAMLKVEAQKANRHR
ncbi:uncharacterized protein CDAR_311161 [Caerostris darwini]|uniref:Uncharacterized protein n=1 Tax=Caerostris darwini TaxID=1538125 RepID=A0AAV4WT90_9ARAC|nr:uncharacterized protein CDAR_311161 [Caerostris darwini]